MPPVPAVTNTIEGPFGRDGAQGRYYVRRLVLAVLVSIVVSFLSTPGVGPAKLEMHDAIRPAPPHASLATPFTRPARARTLQARSTFGLGWLYSKPPQCMPGMLSVVGQRCIDLTPGPMVFTFPVWRKTVQADTPFTIDTSVSNTWYSSGWVQLFVNGCVESVTVNGVRVKEIASRPDAAKCWTPVMLNLSPYLTQYDNDVRIHGIGRASQLGANLIGVRSTLASFVIAACAVFGLIAFCQWLLLPQSGEVRRYLVIGCMSLPAAVTFFLLPYLANGHLPNLSTYIQPLSLEFLPVPFIFLLWLSVIESEGASLPMRFSPVACILSNASLAAVYVLRQNPALQQFACALSMLSGLFVMIPFAECGRQAVHNLRLTLVAAVAASAPHNYYWLVARIWSPMCGWTIKMVYAILHICGMNVYVGGARAPLMVRSPYFNLEVYRPCSGIEGIFLFTFMLSVLFISDWQRFRRHRLLRLYVDAIIFVFILNAIRISAYFTLGYWAYNPHAWHWVSSMRGGTLYMFHTYAGFGFYLLAFMVFVSCSRYIEWLSYVFIVLLILPYYY